MFNSFFLSFLFPITEGMDKFKAFIELLNFSNNEVQTQVLSNLSPHVPINQSSTNAYYIRVSIISQAKEPKYCDRKRNQKWQTQVKEKGNCSKGFGLAYIFLFYPIPRNFLIIRLILILLQDLLNGVERHNKEGVENHADHPNINLLYVCSCRQRLSHTNETV